MTLTSRRPRPLIRETAGHRDTRLFIVACDDTYAPAQYFDFFKIPRVQVHVIKTEDGTSSAPYVLGRLLEYEHDPDDELWMVLDTDHCTTGNHIANFISAIQEAKKHGVAVALTKPSFEFWLLLHHFVEADIARLEDAYACESLLRKHLGEYNKKNLKKIYFPLELVPTAIERAKRLDQQVRGGDIPISNTSRIYLLWEAIISSAVHAELPDGLSALKK